LCPNGLPPYKSAFERLFVSTTFDPDAASQPGSGIFGLSEDPAAARVHVLPVPFDATTSYRKGAARGPAAILRASRQVELFDAASAASAGPKAGKPYLHGICMLEADPRIAKLNEEAGAKADRIIAVGGSIGRDRSLARDLARVNEIGAEVNSIVRNATLKMIDAGKLPVIVGGDHSTPFGAIDALSARHPGLGVLHFDAHADLREAFEGFEWSHASIMHNVASRLSGVSVLVQVGIRDLGEREHERIVGSKGRIRTLFDSEWARARLEGFNLRELVKKRLEQLPEKVYVSFDVDGLDPTLCPNTGTPVPGGLSWHETMLWVEELAKSGRTIVGLDLNEVSPGRTDPEEDSWDAIVGARLLYRWIGAAVAGGS
jgi:agmatinase